MADPRLHVHADGAVSVVGRPDAVAQCLEHLRRTSAHFRALIPDEATDPLKVLAALPVTTKADFRGPLRVEAFEALDTHMFVSDRSSGSTSRPVLSLCRTGDDLAEQHATEAAFARVGLGPDDHFVCMDLGAAEIYDFYFRAARALGTPRCSFLHVTAEYARSVSPLLHLRPTVLLTVPTLLVRAWPHLVAQWPDAATCPVRSLIFMGEPMHPSFRKMVEETWGCRIFSFYGTTETGGLGTECGQADGVHFDPDHVLVTIADADHLDAHTVEGEGLFTTLRTHSQGVVKYRVGDRVRVSTAPCACGDPQPRLWHLERVHDAFVIAGEKFRYQAFREALQAVVPELHLFTVVVEESTDGPPTDRLTVVLPRTAEPHGDAIRDALTESIFELDALFRYGVLGLTLQFEDPSYFTGRKVPRVVDRRRYGADS
ncbi:MAG: hypothetical protein KTR31_16650 [Myxococcales bacterium]|nr:hypothetical protein [Myxococcales bacterium]